jgi:hypothetical protein
VGAIFRIDEHDIAWSEYDGSGRSDAGANIKFKALTWRDREVPDVYFIEYASGYADPTHQHDTGEVLVVTDGELWVNDERNGPGSIVFIPRETDYAVRGGEQGARFFRVVVP